MQDKKTRTNEPDKKKSVPDNSIFTRRTSRRTRSSESFRPIKRLSAATQSLAYASTRTYGWFSMTFGLVSLFLHLAAYYFSSSPSDELSQLVIGAVFALISIPLLLVDIPMCEALQRFPVTDYVLFEFFSIKRLGEYRRRRKARPIIGVIVGIVPAIFGFFFPMESVVLVMLAALFVTVSFVSPELPFLLTLMLAPYSSVFVYSQYVLLAVSLLSLVSFFAKVTVGKRHYSVGLSDVCMIVFALVVFVFGVIGGGRDSTGISLILVALSLNYIPATNIIVNRRLADCAIDAVVFSAVPVSCIAIAQYIIGLVAGERMPSASVMISPYVLATYLCVVLSLAAFSITSVRGPFKRGIYIALLIMISAALVCTECLPVLIVLVTLVPARAILRSHKAPKDLLILLAVVPAFIFLLPTPALLAVSTLSPMNTTLVELRESFLAAFNTFSQSIVVGVGAADLSVPGSSILLNTVLGLGYRFGIFAAVVLGVVCAIRLRQDTVHAAILKSSHLSAFSNMTTVAMFAIAACGWFCDAFADLGLYCLFFSLFGLNTAALRISRREREERAWYFKDQKDVDSSTADIFLRK